MLPPVTVAVAVAVVPIPTPIVDGAAIDIETDEPEYPEPPSFIVSEEIVPATETTAVIAAATGSLPVTIRPLTELITIEDSFSS